jgi:hypothetical protein
MWQGWFNLAAAIWLIMSAFTPDVRTSASMITAGVVITIFGFWGAGERKSWQGIINGLIGVWLLISAIWLDFTLQWNFFIAGIIISLLAIWNILQHRELSNEPLRRKQ